MNYVRIREEQARTAAEKERAEKEKDRAEANERQAKDERGRAEQEWQLARAMLDFLQKKLLRQADTEDFRELARLIR